MKRVLAIAALLMVSCGGNQSESKTTEESGAKKVSAQFSDDKKLPELQMITPKSAPISIDVVTANKDEEFIKLKNLPISDEE